MDRQTVFDPLRKKEVALTPEEMVRQWFIGEVLLHAAGVPAHMMMSEVGFKWGNKQYRADILVFDRSARPLAAVECKRPEVPVNEAVAEQIMRYNAVLDLRFVMLTNGNSTLIFRREGDAFRLCRGLPSYDEMLDWKNSEQ